MVYRKRVYVTIVTIRDKAYKLFVTSTLKKDCGQNPLAIRPRNRH